MPRNYPNFAGQVVTPFTIMTAFIKDGPQYVFEFDTWLSTARFNNDEDPEPRLHRRIPADETFAQTNLTLLGQVQTLFLGHMGLGGRGYTIEDLRWMRPANVLIVDAIKGGGDDRQQANLQGASYATYLAANATAFQNLNTAAWTHAKAIDPFFAAMTAAT